MSHHARSAAAALLGGWFPLAVALAVALAVVGGGCAAASVSSPAGSQSSAPEGAATASPAAGSASPAPAATITAGAVPAGAAQAAARYWRLIDAHRYGPLRAIVTPDSAAAAALRSGQADVFWGIRRVRVVSTSATADPAPPAGATIEFEMTVDITPDASSAWNAGHALVFMSLRRVGDRWLVFESGTGP